MRKRFVFQIIFITLAFTTRHHPRDKMYLCAKLCPLRSICFCLIEYPGNIESKYTNVRFYRKHKQTACLLHSVKKKSLNPLLNGTHSHNNPPSCFPFAKNNKAYVKRQSSFSCQFLYCIKSRLYIPYFQKNLFLCVFT